MAVHTPTPETATKQAEVWNTHDEFWVLLWALMRRGGRGSAYNLDVENEPVERAARQRGAAIQFLRCGGWMTRGLTWYIGSNLN